jgi:hypothetical protein
MLLYPISVGMDPGKKYPFYDAWTAVETLRDEAPLHTASTPPVKAVLAAGYCHDVGEFNGACYAPRDSDRSEGLWKLYPKDAALRRTSFLRSNAEQVKNPRP